MRAWVPVAMLILVALVAFWWAAPRPGFDTPVDLPPTRAGEVVDTKGWLKIHLTRDGEVIVHSRPVNLDELARVLEKEAGESPKEVVGGSVFEIECATLPVLLCIDRAAPLLHAAWVRSLLDNSGFRYVWLGAAAGERRVGVRTFLRPEYWYGNVYCSYVFVNIATQAAGETLFRLGATVPEEGPYTWDRLAPALRKWRRGMQGPAIGVIEADARLPFARLLRMIDALRVTGFDDVEWGTADAHPWIRAQPRLPRPRFPRSVSGGHFLSQRDLFPLTLPVASAGVEDKGDDPDDRIVINLDMKGRVQFKRQPLSLDALGSILAERKKLYDLKMQANGRDGHEKIGGIAVSRLFALLRADRDAPWQRVRWVLHLLEEQDIYKLQFGVLQTADIRYTEEEARLLGAEWEERLPPGLWGPQSKLPCTQPVAGAPLPGDMQRLRVAGRPGRVGYHWNDRKTADVTRVAKWLRGVPAVMIDAEPAVPFKHVVAAVNQLSLAGCKNVHFAEDWPSAHMRSKKPPSDSRLGDLESEFPD